MKILVLTDAFPPDQTGGISKSLKFEVDCLATRGHDVTVLTRRQTTDASTEEQLGDGYRLVRYPAPVRGNPFYYLHPWWTMLTLPLRLRRMQRHGKFDVAYVHNTFLAEALRKSRINIRKVWSFHAPAPREISIDAKKGKYGLKSKLVNGIAERLKQTERRALQTMNHVFTRSTFMLEEIDHWYSNVKIEDHSVIPLCVDTVRFSPALHRELVRADLSIPADAYVLITVRRLVARMGLENLLEAVAELKREHPNVFLIVCGKGYLESPLKQLAQSLGIQDHVRFEGFVDEETLPRYYQAADLFVLPTAELEGFGLATIEALSCGTPALATPVGANPAVVGPLGPQYLTRSTSAADIALGIRMWINTSNECDIRRQCRAFILQRYSQDIIAQQLETVFANEENHDRAAA